jgi:hypothetical protein
MDTAPSLSRTLWQRWSPFSRGDDATRQAAERAHEAVAAAPPEVLVAWFEADTCRNCGADLSGKYCSACGQEKAARLGQSAVRKEAWDKLRVYENDLVRSTLRVFHAPGTVAREFVLGMRKRHVHPLKLLLAAIAVLLIVLAQTRYLSSSSVSVNKALEVIKKYADWSFSLGVVAILASSWLVFGRRLGYNLVEHLVLAVYTHFLVLCAAILNLLPLLMWRDAAWLAWHKQYSGYWMTVIELGVVALAFTQFFHIETRRDVLRLTLATALFYGIKKSLLWLYAWTLVKLVLANVL